MSEPKLTTLGHDEAGAGGVTGATDQPDGGRQNSLWSDAWRQLRRNALFWIGAVLGLLFVGMALLPSVFARGVDPRSCSLSNSNAKPSAEHWFGFDQQGCDYLANVVYGARNSLIIGLLAVIVILVLGVLVARPADSPPSSTPAPSPAARSWC